MDDPKDLREFARWYFAAAENARDPRIKMAMAAQGRDLLARADGPGRAYSPRVVINAST